MADITITAADVRPLNGAIMRRYTAGASGSVGDIVALQADGFVDPADADAIGTADAHGVVVGVQATVGETTFASGDVLDVVVFGPVKWGASMTIPGRVYVSATAGKGDQTPPAATGDFPKIIGYAEAADVLFVHPATALPVENS